MTTTTSTTAAPTEAVATASTADAPALIRFRPTGLDTAPEVNALLERLGLGPFAPDGLTAFGGRNDNWAGTTTLGRQVFVKTVARASDGGRPEIDRALAFEASAARLPAGSPLRTPEHLGTDRDSAVSAFRLLPGSRSGSEVALDGDFDEALCREAGRAVATLHTLGTADGEDPDAASGPAIDTAEAPLPPMRWLRAFPWSEVQDRSMAQIAAWKLVQDDTEVVAALHRLRDRERTAPHTPAHCDLRFDQFLVHDGQLYLCDWEEFRLADPARDVGAFVGEWLFQATYSVFAPTGEPTTAKDAVAFGFDLSHEEIVERGAAGLRHHIPRIAAFWQGYTECRTPDPELAERAVGFAGWHLYDRLIATAQAHAVLNPVARAAAGIGRTLLLNPAGAVATLRLAASATTPPAVATAGVPTAGVPAPAVATAGVPNPAVPTAGVPNPAVAIAGAPTVVVSHPAQPHPAAAPSGSPR
ncbi:class V lanthionine synthetase subunit LxmK [Streptomyces rubiginosohelvolus]|uniref:class V lanthionine synthetase subunit LxmK n=1 Tax=Streptomyces rubiginosohelvolus TaxID=67362 RepID=UPI00371B622D